MTETIICECGAIIRGSSKDHALANLKIHKTAKRHKELIKLKKEQEGASKRNSEGSGSKDEGVENDNSDKIVSS